MGLLVDGKWQVEELKSDSGDGRFKRKETTFRDWVTADGSSGFPAEAGRYHLYVSLACPWAHRTLILRTLKGLEEAIPVSVVNPLMADKGWSFEPYAGSTDDPVHQARHLHEVYAAAKPDYTGRVSVPVLFDRKTGAIVSNESADIIRMFNNAFDALATAELPDMYPAELRGEIDRVNQRVYETVNNGVYRAGFATSQDAYEEAFETLFETMDWLEERLSGSRYLVGGRLTEADWRLFTTLVRFDPVYVGHFKCNRQRLADYPNLWNYTKDLYQVPGVAGTVNLEQIKAHYYWSHTTINPKRIVPGGPDVDFGEPHDRERFARAA